MGAKVTVTATAGPIEGEVFTFTEHDTFIFGRAPECHARLPETDPSCSRHHFVLEVNPPQVRLRDLGSRNGTNVNGVKYGGQKKDDNGPLGVDLRDGDKIRVGKTHFEITIAGGPRRDSTAGDDESSFVMFRNRESSVGQSRCRCASCGQDVTMEIALQDTDAEEHICENCRGGTDPIAILRRIALEESRKQGVAPKPALPGFDVGKLLGKGGMGAVYQATRLEDGQVVALKVMLSRMAVDEDARKLFEREINVTRSLDHPNIVKLIDYGSIINAFYFAMELCPGGSFASLRKKHDGKVPLEVLAPLFIEALEGLAFAHESYFVHRDIKPENILLTEVDGGQAKLSDFGLAKSFDTAGLSGITMVGNTAGTFHYMSREQVTNFKWVKPVSDVWSMGAVFYRMVTAEFPRYEDPSKNPLAAILEETVIPIREREKSVPRAVAKVIDRSVEISVRKRYQNGAEFLKALKKAL